jgi:hypothetical protein
LVTLASGVGAWWRYEPIYVARSVSQNTNENVSGAAHWDLFPRCRHLAAKDAKDHIYGLIGLTHCNLVVDYSLDILSVYGNYVQTWMHDTQRMDVLLYSGIGIVPGTPRPDLPSWFPNYPYEDRDHDQFKNRRNAFLGYQADEGVFNMENGDLPILDGSSLFATAIVGPTIQTVKHISFPSVDLYNFAIDFHRRHRGRQAYVRGIHPSKAFFQVIIGDETCIDMALVSRVWEISRLMQPSFEHRGQGKYPGENLLTIAHAFDGVLDSIDGLFLRAFAPDADVNTVADIQHFINFKTWETNYHWDRADLGDEWGKDNSDAADYAMAMTTLTQLHEWCLCMTEDGYFGVGPNGTLP